MMNSANALQKIDLEFPREIGPFSHTIPEPPKSQEIFQALLKDIASGTVTYSWFWGRKWTLASTGKKQYSLSQLYKKAVEALKETEESNKIYKNMMDFKFSGYDSLFKTGHENYTLQDLEDIFYLVQGALKENKNTSLDNPQFTQMTEVIIKIDHDSDAEMVKKTSIIYRIYLSILRFFCNGTGSHQTCYRQALQKHQSTPRLRATLEKTSEVEVSIRKSILIIRLDKLIEILQIKQKNLTQQFNDEKAFRSLLFEREKKQDVIYVDSNAEAYLASDEYLDYLFQEFLEAQKKSTESIQMFRMQHYRIHHLLDELFQCYHKELPGEEEELPFQNLDNHIPCNIKEMTVKSWSFYVKSLDENDQNMSDPDIKNLKKALQTGQLEIAFGLPNLFTQEELQDAAKRVFKKTHPDKNPHLSAGFFQAFRDIHLALSCNL